MAVRYRKMLGTLIAGSMLFGSTGAIASVAPVSTYQPDPWAVLSVMNGGASAVAVCGTAAAAVAAQAPGGGCVLPQVDAAPPVAQNPPPQPIPVPPVEPASSGLGLGISPLLIALVAIAAGVGLYFVLHKHHANSPA
jgi:hypothetical protein